MKREYEGQRARLQAGAVSESGHRDAVGSQITEAWSPTDEPS
jgi:hypothetical protein